MIPDDVAALLTSPPHKCDRCDNPIMLAGLCQTCRISDLEKSLKALQETIREYMPMVIPKGKHMLTNTHIRGLGAVPVWVSVVVKTPVLVVAPEHFNDVPEYIESGMPQPVQIIKDEWQAAGGAARSTERRKIEMDPVEGEPMGRKR